MPRWPTRQDYLDAGVDPAVLDRIEAEQADRAANPVSPPAPRKPDPQDDPEYHVLRMAPDKAAAAERFMDASWEAGIRDHGMWKPSDLWTFGWAMIGTSHMTLWPIKSIRPPAYLDRLSAPCSLGEILLYANKPALTIGEARHRADVFCRHALERARQIYREGFYADPFTKTPTRRPTKESRNSDA